MSTKTRHRTRKVEDDNNDNNNNDKYKDNKDNKDNKDKNNDTDKYNDTDNDAGDNETMKARERDLYGEVFFFDTLDSLIVPPSPHFVQGGFLLIF